MKPDKALHNTSNEFSGRITQQLVIQAERLFGEELEQDRLAPLLENLVEDAQGLVETERKQLSDIAELLSHSRNQPSNSTSLNCSGDFELTTSDDGMFLLLSVRPPVAGGDAVAINDVLRQLKAWNIKRGVDLNTIRRCLHQASKGQDVKNVVVVRGKLALPGKDARVEYFARRNNELPPEAVGLRYIEQAQALLCREGDVVMKYIPIIPGEPGHTAMGQPLDPPLPADIEVSVGRNIRQDGHDFIAEVTGVVIFEGNHVEARKALILNQDVTSKNEPIDFDGEVHIHAAVRSGASIKATGNIIIDGPVEAAHLESQEGDVVLRSGVAGKHMAIIRAGRDIHTRFAESANLLAGRDITMQVGSLHCDLIAYQSIQAIQGKGQLAGGTIMAGDRIRVKQLGARGGVPTKVTVGLSPAVLQEIGEIDKQAVHTVERKANCTQLIQQIERAIGDPLKLQPRELETYTKLRQLQVVCDVQLRKFTQQRREKLAEALQSHDGRIDIMMNIMPNVTVTIGGGELEPEPRMGPCSLQYDKAASKIVLQRSL